MMARSVTAFVYGTEEANPRADLLKPRKSRDKLATSNKRLAEQIRKVLGKHYASKYRVR
jgi:hypothetical protein